MIDKVGSMQRNSLLARHLREFPNQAVGGAGGVLVALPGASLKHMRYTRPELLELSPETVLLSLGLDNKNQNP